ncbi:MAG: acyl-CoA carboxylase subunit epsilon [Kineosporiaceae bacterium]|nr:acyl-CoA carboxylase subunit epsilon [Aeromicrobium sp.]
MSDETEPQDSPVAKPILRVVKGDLSPEELAALVAVIAARNAAAANAAARAKPKIRSAWGHPVAMARKPHQVGPGAWRQSALGR